MKLILYLTITLFSSFAIAAGNDEKSEIDRFFEEHQCLKVPRYFHHGSVLSLGVLAFDPDVAPILEKDPGFGVLFSPQAAFNNEVHSYALQGAPEIRRFLIEWRSQLLNQGYDSWQEAVSTRASEMSGTKDAKKSLLVNFGLGSFFALSAAFTSGLSLFANSLLSAIFFTDAVSDGGKLASEEIKNQLRQIEADRSVYNRTLLSSKILSGKVPISAAKPILVAAKKNHGTNKKPIWEHSFLLIRMEGGAMRMYVASQMPDIVKIATTWKKAPQKK